MNQFNQASRAIIWLSKSISKPPKVNFRSMVTTNINGLVDTVVYTSSNTLNDSSLAHAFSSKPETNSDKPDSKDENTPIIAMGRYLSRGGLKWPKNRDLLVTNLYNLTESILKSQVSVEEFVSSEMFGKLHYEFEHNIDLMSNSQIISSLASLIIMQIDSSNKLIQLLEHEVQFRMNKFSLQQILKLWKLYNTHNSNEISSEQKPLVDKLIYRMQAHIQDDTVTLGVLNSFLHLIATQQAPNSLLSFIEERQLNILTLNSVDKEDIVERIITNKVFDYESLCDLFVVLAKNNRRPTPSLRAASIELCKIQISGDTQVNTKILIETLKALISLNYPHPILVSKLVNDLSSVIKLEEMDTNSKCDLLGIMQNLRWRSDDLLNKFFEHIECCDERGLDYRLLTALFRIAALMNYRDQEKIRQIYERFMKGEGEKSICKPRKWLSYVWSLVTLNIAEESHLRSVLNNEFCRSLESSSTDMKIQFSDAMRLLNIKALASNEFKLAGLDFGNYESLTRLDIQRGPRIQNFVSKIREALNGVVKSPEEIRCDILTPYGFMIDFQLLVNKNLETVPFDACTTTEFASPIKDIPSEEDSTYQRVAIIFVPYEDTVASHSSEVLGHKQIISRILKSVGQKTVFLPEPLLNRDFTEVIKTSIEASLTSNCQS